MFMPKVIPLESYYPAGTKKVTDTHTHTRLSALPGLLEWPVINPGDDRENV